MMAVDFSEENIGHGIICVNAWSKYLVTTSLTTEDNYIPMTIKIYETCNFYERPEQRNRVAKYFHCVKYFYNLKVPSVLQREQRKILSTSAQSKDLESETLMPR